MIKQLTFDARHHQLTNINGWTADSQWLIFDVRPAGNLFTGTTIERVNVNTGDTEVVFQATDGACVGVVTAHPYHTDRCVFIHGPERPDAEWHYDFHHRRGVISERGKSETLDALKIMPPYQAGALRGGSHVHVWSPDGSRLSFTYNDHVMHERGPIYDQRNVGIALPCGPVTIYKQHPREYSGSHYCVLISKTTVNPQAGSDEICRAYEEGWVGHEGYRKTYGDQQRWALAFIGDTLALTGETVPELFIVDLPETLAACQLAGSQPLEGTDTALPSPPAGVVQRRLTFTHHRRFPGLARVPRHWIRSSPDGTQLAFLMQDDQGTAQLWVISPQGGEPRQVTSGTLGVASAFNWHPSGRYVGFVQGKRLVLCDVARGAITAVMPEQSTAPSGDAVLFSPDGQSMAWVQHDTAGFQQLFIVGIGSNIQ